MDRHLGDWNVPSFTIMSYEKGTVKDAQKDELAILDRNIDCSSTDLLTSFVPLTTHTPVLGIQSEESYFDTKEHTDDSWLVSEATNALFNLHADFSAFLEIWKPSVELDNESKISQTTTAVAERNVENISLNQVALSITSPLLQLNSLQKDITIAGNKKEQQMDKWYCVFCFNNARFAYEKGGIILHPQLNGPWRTHVCKDPKGVVICPVLAAHVCRHCGATGKFAHTEKYCDSEKKRNQQTMNLRRIG
ncbi:unnamed protein product [Cercopithifilaria johnstoni]|uniref:Nanos-type domain-containing protein n=1 Tax=Cercopithifilaria johnstoni TaxID=2874296 RepID=A0A8J2MER8_9BILA|nr:unnamed protein product [Cercopithifilaria johnstoni]